MKDDEYHLWDVSSHNDDANDLNGNEEASVQATDTKVECQAGKTAKKECCRIDDVGSEIENLGSHNDIGGQNMLDVREMSTRSKPDELDANAYEGDKASLSGQVSHRHP